MMQSRQSRCEMKEAAACITKYIAVSVTFYLVCSLDRNTEKLHSLTGILNNLSFWSTFSKCPEGKSDISSGLDILADMSSN